MISYKQGDFLGVNGLVQGAAFCFEVTMKKP
jgi:hypothetical protein